MWSASGHWDDELKKSDHDLAVVCPEVNDFTRNIIASRRRILTNGERGEVPSYR